MTQPGVANKKEKKAKSCLRETGSTSLVRRRELFNILTVICWLLFVAVYNH